MSSEAPPPPERTDPGRDLKNYVSGLQQAMPAILGMENTYRSQFGALNMQDIGAALFGSNGTPGIISMGKDSTGAAQQELQDAKRGELIGQAGNAALARDVTAATSPEAAQMVERQTQMANDRYDASAGLNMQEKRLADQTAREAFAARGRLNDNASVAAEILGREEVLAAKRAEAAQLGSQAFGMAQQQSDFTRGQLSNSSPSVLLGQDYLNRGSNAIGQNVPQLVDTGVGLSIGQNDAANIAAWQQQKTAADNANKSQAVGIGTALASAAIYGLAAASDERVKTDKKKVGKTDSGLPIYTYKLLGSPQTQMGVMAQDVEKKQPTAAGPVLGGIKTVNYAKIR